MRFAPAPFLLRSLRNLFVRIHNERWFFLATIISDRAFFCLWSSSALSSFGDAGDEVAET